MNSIWCRTLCLLAAGASLGVASNLAGPHKIPWIRGAAAGDAAPSGLQGDLSTDAIRLFSETGFANLLDARRAEDFQKGHIPHALSFDVRAFDEQFPKFSETLKSLMANGLPFVIYCNGGHCEDSHTLSEKLKAFGIKPLVYSGGWEAWSTAGMPIETGDAK